MSTKLASRPQQPHGPSFIVLDGTTLELDTRDARPSFEVTRGRGSLPKQDSMPAGLKGKSMPTLRSHQTVLGLTGSHAHTYGSSDNSPARGGNPSSHLSGHLEKLAITQRTLHQHPRNNLRAAGPLPENSPLAGDPGLVAKGVAVTLHSDADGDDTNNSSMRTVAAAKSGNLVRLNLHVDTINLAGPACGRYENWDSQLTQRSSADSPKWVAYRAQDSPGDLRPESNGLGGLDAPPLTPSILRLTSDSRGSCGPMWSSQELAELPYIGDDDPHQSSAATSDSPAPGTAAQSA